MRLSVDRRTVKGLGAKLKFLVSLSSEDARELQILFRAKGIPVYLERDVVRENQGTGSIATVRDVPRWYRVHVPLDEQYADARTLLNDPAYEVKAPVDVANFEREMKRLGDDQRAKIPDALLNLLIGGLLLLVAAAILIALRG